MSLFSHLLLWIYCAFLNPSAALWVSLWTELPCLSRIYREKWAISSPISCLLGRCSSCSKDGSCPRPLRRALTSLTSTLLFLDLRFLFLCIYLSISFCKIDNDWLIYLCNLGDEAWSWRIFPEALTPGGLPPPSRLSLHKVKPPYEYHQISLPVFPLLPFLEQWEGDSIQQPIRRSWI